MDLQAQSSFLAALISTVLAVAVALRATDRRQALLFALLAGNLALWHLADFLFAATGAALFTRLQVATAMLLPATCHRFFLAFLSSHALSSNPEAHEPASRRIERVVLIGALTGIGTAVTPLVLEPVFKIIVVVYVIGMLVAVLYLVNQHRQTTASRIERIRLTYVLVGGGIALVSAGTGFVPGMSGLFAALSNVGLVVYLYFLSQAILRHRLLDLNELLGRIVVLSGLALVLGVVFAVIVAAVGDNPALLLFNIVLTSFVLMTLFEPLRSRLESRVMSWLFSERYDLTRALEGLRRELPGIIDVKEASIRILERLYETNRITHAAVYLLSADETGFVLLASRGPDAPKWLDAVALGEVVDVTRGGQQAILRETTDRHLREARRLHASRITDEDDDPAEPEELVRLRRIHDVMERLSSGVLVPLLDGRHVLGLVSLYDERVFEAYSTNEIAAILSVANALTTLVRNSKLYDRMKERDRLATLGEMSAGLAHEIRNPLGAIKAAAQYLDPDSLDDDRGEFLQVIIEEVDRLNGVVTQFLDYARPLKTHFSPTDVNRLVELTVKLVEKQGLPGAVSLELELGADLPKVEADAEQLKQVLLNLLLNALQAVGESGRIEVRTALRPGAQELELGAEGGGGTVEIRVSDDGPGIPDDVRESLFIPFFTTKDQGTGLGLPISQRLVRNHGGTLEVHEARRGAVFVVRLPVPTVVNEIAGKDDTGTAEILPLRRSG